MLRERRTSASTTEGRGAATISLKILAPPSLTSGQEEGARAGFWLLASGAPRRKEPSTHGGRTVDLAARTGVGNLKSGASGAAIGFNRLGQAPATVSSAHRRVAAGAPALEALSSPFLEDALAAAPATTTVAVAPATGRLGLGATRDQGAQQEPDATTNKT